LNNPVYFANSHAAPEVVVAFVYTELSSASASRLVGAYDATVSSAAARGHTGGALAYARSAMAGAASSLTAPFYTPTAAVSDQVVALHNSLTHNAKVFATQIDADSSSSGSTESLSGCAALLGEMDEHPAMYADGRSDLVLVKLAAYQPHDTCVQTVSEHVRTRTNGNFVALLSADSAFAFPVQSVFVENEKRAFSPQLNMAMGDGHSQRFRTLAATTTNSTNAFPGILFVTPTVMWGLILGLIFVIAVSCGVGWVQSIETPARFTTVPLQLTKEY